MNPTQMWIAIVIGGMCWMVAIADETGELVIHKAQHAAVAIAKSPARLFKRKPPAAPPVVAPPANVDGLNPSNICSDCQPMSCCTKLTEAMTAPARPPYYRLPVRPPDPQ